MTLTDWRKCLSFSSWYDERNRMGNVDGVLIPMENGVPAKLVKGKTWISFVPTKPGIENMVNTLP